MILGITGMPGSGKEIALAFAAENKITIISLGKIVRDTFYMEQKEKSFEEIGNYANMMREVNGKCVWARKAMKIIKSSFLHTKTFILIEGIRSIHEVNAFKTELGERLYLLAIHSSPKTRFERLLKRERIDDPKNLESFTERDRRELSWGLGDVIALADFHIINEETIDDLQYQLEKLFQFKLGIS